MTPHPVKRRKKLIEVAIPLEAINKASARALIFLKMVEDPPSVPEEFPADVDQKNERNRLFALISELLQWEYTNNEKVLNQASEKIRRSWPQCCDKECQLVLPCFGDT